jgi:hypothetical protein
VVPSKLGLKIGTDNLPVGCEGKGRGRFKLVTPDRNIVLSLKLCKLVLKGGTISVSDGERRCRLIPRREYSFFSSFTDTEQIRVKKLNG